MFEVTQQGEIAILRMAHGKVNTIDLEFCQGLIQRIDEVKGSSSKALVLTGEGSIFSAGLDLVRVLAEGADYLKRLAPGLSKVFDTLFFYPKPVVVAVNGHAIAGGCVLACAADHRIMARGIGRIGLPELLVGVPLPTIALEIMRFVTNPQQLQRLLYEGRTYLPEDAVGLGLADELVEPPELLAKAVERAERLAAISPRTFEHTKRQIRQPVQERVLDGQSRFEPAVWDMWSAPETLETMRAYVARTLNKT